MWGMEINKYLFSACGPRVALNMSTMDIILKSKSLDGWHTREKTQEYTPVRDVME